MIVLFWILLTLVVAAWAKNWNRSFFLYLIISIILSPLAGGLILLISGKTQSSEDKKSDAERYNIITSTFVLRFRSDSEKHMQNVKARELFDDINAGRKVNIDSVKTMLSVM
ncbi:hypothetical protein [Photobacterium indicum]|uniref:Uncharacterized protein n=1 Tax=Photobacterium indicum TaxID=81447 RepID=A0A2T3L3D1_9GAMM|nr:hypothetical protein [Photobacterium indicum]PSV43618.1 hypothetical protein C9J47_22380 [Photobacterium indicum]